MEFKEDILKALNERFTNPLIIAFTLSWLSFNYPFLLVLFEDWDATRKLGYISSALYPDWQSVVGHWIGGPLAVGLAATALHAFLDRWLQVFFNHQRTKSMKKIEELAKLRGVLLHEHEALKNRAASLALKNEELLDEIKLARDEFHSREVRIMSARSQLRTQLEEARERLNEAGGRKVELEDNEPEIVSEFSLELYMRLRGFKIPDGFLPHETVRDFLSIRRFKPDDYDLPYFNDPMVRTEMASEGVSGFELVLLGLQNPVDSDTLMAELNHLRPRPSFIDIDHTIWEMVRKGLFQAAHNGSVGPATPLGIAVHWAARFYVAGMRLRGQPITFEERLSSSDTEPSSS